MHVLFGAVLYVGFDRGTQRQPRPVRPALPHDVFLQRGKPCYPLSLKDLCAAQYLRDIEKAGVKCVKIEGRMKRPEYTALVTKIYKDAVTFGRNPSKDDIETLRPFSPATVLQTVIWRIKRAGICSA